MKSLAQEVLDLCEKRDKDWQVLLWSKNITDDEKDKKFTSKFDISKHPILWKAYDDDKVFYAEGTCTDDSQIMEEIVDDLAGKYGVTAVKFFDRKTNKYIDEIS